MNLLILGGTAWLGRAIASAALDAGHSVTCVARGENVPEGVTLIRADRDTDDALAAVTSQHWDAIIDVARQPGQVRRAVSDLEPVADRYVFVSSGSAYADQGTIGQDEDAPRLPPLDADAIDTPDDYGSAKVACEDAVIAAFGADRSLIARAGLIGGPGDHTGRTGYWPWRFSHPAADDGTVLVPELPELPAALIDVRDLAAWLVACAVDGTTGVVNAGGIPIPLPDFLEIAREVAGHHGSLAPVSSGWLLDHGVNEWSGPRSLPLWLADRDWWGLNSRSNDRALAAGLRLRPLRETLADTLEWELAQAHPGPHGAGLTDAEERELLTALAADGSRPQR
ncbi:NAD-dependent epimerase/dehydratase family protein [Glaciihabitans sp. dw_435]|uniref:NAD-dependent epimerase/dehydratase family protein n=1 Tax=Glaciihabitans sp. dw_435 TaxID=2720081 RepID=UPI001BD4204B|nr:NAD-dependent epimerase/dehydratase family protein [Glaciihabitans sp. dw_435]